MADNSIKRNPNLLYNNIEEQRLLYNNQLSLQDWNRIINELKTQANVNTKYLEQFIEWFMHGDAKYLELPTDESFVDYILDLLNYINSNYFHPDSTVEGEVVQAVSCETVELLRHEMEYNIGGTIPIATSENYQGPRDSDIPTTQLMRNLIDDAVEDSIVVRNLGVLSESPEIANNEYLNSIEDSGVYTFNYNKTQYLMILSKKDNTALKQLLIYEKTLDHIEYMFRFPYYGIWRVENYTISNTEEIPTKVSELTNDVGYITETYVNNQIGTKVAELVNSAPETLDTLGELAEAINNHKDAYDALLEIVSKKADKKEIPVKISDLVQDIEIGVDLNIKKGLVEGSTQSIGDYSTEGTSVNTAVYINEDGKEVFNFNHGFNANGVTAYKEATGIDLKTTPLPYGAVGHYAQSYGGKSSAQGKRSLAEGTTTIALGDYSHAEGNTTVALGGSSHAEGLATTAVGNGSHAEGSATLASNTNAHAEGNVTEASGTNSHAEGNITKATKSGSHSEGHQTLAGGWSAHAQNYYTQATGDHTHAGGIHTIASTTGQTAIGIANKENKNALFIVGNGTYSGATVKERKNAFEVLKDGRVKATGTPTEENDLTPKSYVDNLVSLIPKFSIQVVEEFPSDRNSTTIYLKTNPQDIDNLYEEWICVNDTWELLGTAKIKLDDYALKTEIPTNNNQLENGAGYIKQDALNGYATEQWVENKEYTNKRLTPSLVACGTEIPNGADLNTVDYLKVGNYWCKWASIATSLSNCPTKIAFKMEVYSPILPEYDNEDKEAGLYRIRRIIDNNANIWFQVVYKKRDSETTPYYWVYKPWEQVTYKSETDKKLNMVINGSVEANADYHKVYIAKNDGTQSTLSISPDDTKAGSVVQRNWNGQIVTAGPTANNHAATKLYVDDLVGNIKALLEAI